MTTPRLQPATCIVCDVRLTMEYPGQLTRSTGDGVLLCDAHVDALLALVEEMRQTAVTPTAILDQIDQAGWPRRAR